MDDEVQLCPFCTQPFSGNKMILPFFPIYLSISLFQAFSIVFSYRGKCSGG